ncbi:MAG: hypothetical protein U0638_00575 [Phycisphaerales bacterium]
MSRWDLRSLFGTRPNSSSFRSARTPGRLARLAGSRASMRQGGVETLEPRQYLGGDHPSFSQFPTADTITVNGTSGLGSLGGVIGTTGDDDLFKFVAPANDFVSILADAQNASSTLNTQIRLYDSSGVELQRSSGNDTLTAGVPTDAWIGFVATAGQTYYVGVRSDASSGNTATGAYTVRVDAITSKLSVKTTGTSGIGNLYDTALGSGRAIKGTLTRPEHDIIYEFTIPTDTAYDSLATFNVQRYPGDTTHQLDTRLDVYDSTGKRVLFDSPAGRDNDAFASLKTSPGQKLYLRVRSDEFLASRSVFATGTYVVTADVRAEQFTNVMDPVTRRGSDPGVSLFAYTGQDADKAFQTAVYEFVAQGSGLAFITAVGGGLNPVQDGALRVYNASGSLLAYNDNFASSDPQVAIVLEGGKRYFAVLDAFNLGGTDYSVFVEANHTFDTNQPVDDHPNTNSTTDTRWASEATSLIWGAPFALTDQAGNVIEDRSMRVAAFGTGRLWGSGDTDLFKFVPQVDMLGSYAGKNDDAGTALYAGGNFTNAGTVNTTIPTKASGLGAWDANDWWPALGGLLGPNVDGNGDLLPGVVYALLEYDLTGDGRTELIAGGSFTTARNTTNPDEDIPVSGLAMYTWNALTGQYEWAAIGTGVTKSGDPGTVYALAVYDGDAKPDGNDPRPVLMVGGDFTRLAGANANRIGYITQDLTINNEPGITLPNLAGTEPVRVITSGSLDFGDPDDGGPLEDPAAYTALIIGGEFHATTQTVGTLDYLVVLKNDYSTYYDYRTLAGTELNGAVYAAAAFAYTDDQDVAHNGVVVGGAFSITGATRCTFVDVSAAAPVANNLSATGNVYAMAAYDAPDPDEDGPFPDPAPALAIGGAFTTLSGTPRTAKIATWDGLAVSALGNGLGGGDVRAIAVVDDVDVGVPTGNVLYLGGSFASASYGTTTVNVNRMTKWQFNSLALEYEWYPMGSGAAAANVVPNATNAWPTENGVNGTVFTLAAFDDGNENQWDRHSRRSSRVSLLLAGDADAFANMFITVYDSDFNAIYTNDTISPPFPDPSGAIDWSIQPGSLQFEGPTVWAGETYYIEVRDATNSGTGRYTLRVIADAFVQDDTNSQIFDPVDRDNYTDVQAYFGDAIQLSQPFSTGDAQNFFALPFVAPTARQFQATQESFSPVHYSELGNIPTVTNDDLFSFRAQASGYAEIRLNTTNLVDYFDEYLATGPIETSRTYSSNFDGALRIYDADFTQIAYVNDVATITGEPSGRDSTGTWTGRTFHKRDPRVVIPVTEGEFYYVVIESGQRWVDGSFADAADRTARTGQEIDAGSATGSYELLINGMSDLDVGTDDHSAGVGSDGANLATPIMLGEDPQDSATNGKGSITGTINNATDVDDITFVSISRGTATLDLSRLTGSTVTGIVSVFTLRNGQATVVAGGTAGSSGALQLTFPVTPGERFYIRVSSSASSLGDYKIDLSVPPFADDYADRKDLVLATDLPQFDFLGTGQADGKIEQPGDTDVFRFTSYDFQTMTVLVHGKSSSTFNPFVTIYEVSEDPLGNPIILRIAYNDNRSSTNFDAEVSFSVAPDRTSTLTNNSYPYYYIVVSASDSSDEYGDYTVTLSFPPTDDHPDAGEYTYASGITIDPGTGAGVATGITEKLSDTDLFVFNAAAGGEAGVIVSRPSDSEIVPTVTIIELVSDVPVTVATGTAFDDGLTFDPADTGIFNVVRGHKYYVLISNSTATFGAYTISVNSPVIDDYPNITEFDIAYAIPMSSATGNGVIGDGIPGDLGNPKLLPIDDTDLFKFSPIKTGPVVITLTSYYTSSGRFAPRLRVFDNTQTLIGEATTNDIPNASTPVAVTYTFPTLSSSTTYYVLVSAVENLDPPATLTGEYQLIVDGDSPPNGDGDDPGQIDFNTPTTIVINPRNGDGYVSDTINVSGDRDLFRFRAPSLLGGRTSGRAFVQVRTPEGSVLDAAVTILNAANEQSVVVYDAAGIPGANANVSFTANSNADYWIIVSGIGSGVGAYEVLVDTEPGTNYLYFPEGYTSSAIREFVSLANTNAFPVQYTVRLRYEDGSPETVVVNNFTIAAGARDGVTISDAANGHATGVLPDKPYAVIVESTGLLGATLAHYDFGSAIGDSFTPTLSDDWSFARVERVPGAVIDIIPYYNPNPFSVTVTLKAFGPNGESLTYNQTVGASKRFGFNIHDIATWPIGISGARLTAAATNSQNQIDFIGVAASLSHYDAVNGEGFALVADPAGGSTTGTVPQLTNGDTVTAELALFNPSNTVAAVQLRGKYVAADLPDLIRIINVPAGRSVVLKGTDLQFVPNQPIGIAYSSNVAVVVTGSQRSFGDADATGTTSVASNTLFFGDAFINTTLAGSLYFETLAFSNPTNLNVNVKVTLQFTGVNDTLSVFVPVNAGDFAQLKLHELPELIIDRPGLNFFSVIVDSVVPITATMTHYDLYLGGGWTTSGVPLGITVPYSQFA